MPLPHRHQLRRKRAGQRQCLVEVYVQPAVIVRLVKEDRAGFRVNGTKHRRFSAGSTVSSQLQNVLPELMHRDDYQWFVPLVLILLRSLRLLYISLKPSARVHPIAGGKMTDIFFVKIGQIASKVRRKREVPSWISPFQPSG